MKRSFILFICCLLFLSVQSLKTCPDCLLTAHTVGQPFFAHVLPEQTYQGTPLERNIAREEELKEGCAHCGENHE